MNESDIFCEDCRYIRIEKSEYPDRKGFVSYSCGLEKEFSSEKSNAVFRDYTYTLCTDRNSHNDCTKFKKMETK